MYIGRQIRQHGRVQRHVRPDHPAPLTYPRDPHPLLPDLDLHRRRSISQAETNKAQRNQLTEEIARLRRAGLDAAQPTEQVRELKIQFERLEETAATADAQLRELMQTLPNLPQDSVPVGKSEHDNRIE